MAGSGLMVEGRRYAQRLRLAAWALWSVTVLEVGVSLVLWIADGLPPPPIRFVELAGGAATAPAAMFYALAFASIGLFLALQRIRNLIGWIFLLVALPMALTILANRYIGTAIRVGAVEPVHQLVAWLISSFHFPYIAILLMTFILIFPEGAIPPRRPAAVWVAVAAATLLGISAALLPGQLLWYPDVHNPFALAESSRSVLSILALAGVALGLCAVGLAGVALAAKYRNASGIERRQFKWILYSSAILAVIAGPFIVLQYAVRDSEILGPLIAISLIATTLVPLATAFAVMRYRLYDIDLIINRTLVYLLLTGILGGAFAGLIALLQRVSVVLSGDESDAALVLTTLIVASLVTPVRKAIETVVDERFKPSRTGSEPASGGLDGGLIGGDLASRLDALSEHIRDLDEQTLAVAFRVEALEGRLMERHPRRSRRPGADRPAGRPRGG